MEAKLDGANEGSWHGASALAFSPAGDALYVAGFEDNAVVVFSRNLTAAQLAPQLSWAERETDGSGVPLVDGLAGARGVEVSPDGSLVFVAGATDGQDRDLQPQYRRRADPPARLPRHRRARLGGRPGDHAGGRAGLRRRQHDRHAGYVLGDARRRLRGPGRVGPHLLGVRRPFRRRATSPTSRRRCCANDASGTLVNTATVAAPAGVDTNAANNSSTDSDPVGSEADITRDEDGQSDLGRPRRVGGLHPPVTNAGPANVRQRLGDGLRTHQRRLLVGELELRRPGRMRSADRPPPAPATSTPAT